MSSTAKKIAKAASHLATLPYGVRFFKADFHFHTPASEDARGKNRYGFNPYKHTKYPKNDHSWEYVESVRSIQVDILQSARKLAEEMIVRFEQEGLSMVAITDHNGIGTIWPDPDDPKGKSMDLAAPTWYELISDAAERRNREVGGRPIVILPGTEISTTGVHILAIFPPSHPKRKIHFTICDLLTEVGFAVDDFGRNPKVGRASVYDTLDLIHKKGGLPIIAHIDGSDQSLLDLYKIKSGAMKKVLGHPHLSAIEMVKPERLGRKYRGISGSLGDWIAEVRRKAHLDPMAYFQGSDAHDLKNIGKRFTYLKMSEPSFSGLSNAIQSASSRIRVGDLHTPPEEGRYLYGVEFKNKFFGHQYVRFNRHFNCVVGRKESGKSYLFHMMQMAADEAVDIPDDGRAEARLFVNVRQNDRSNLYCFTRRRDEVQLYALTRPEEANGDRPSRAAPIVTRIPASDSRFHALRPRFYNPERIELLIQSMDDLQSVLVQYLGRPTASNARRANALFAISTFLSPKPSPLLHFAVKNGQYELSFNVAWRRGKPKLVPFAKMTRSLRRVAIVAIVLLTGKSGPLLIDEPAGHFDNEDIATYIVPLLKYTKNQEQIILTTANANLTVNADPENVIVLEANAQHLERLHAGFAIDHQDEREALIKLMEGTMRAYRKRGLRYAGTITG